MKRMFLLSVISILSISFVTLANDINAGGQKGIVRAMSAETFSKTGIHVGGAFRYAKDWDLIGTIIDNSDPSRYIDRGSPELYSGNIFAAYGLTYFLDLSADFPLYWDKTGWKQDRAGAGDLQIAAKLQYPWQKKEAAVSHAFFLKAVLPTGSDNRGFFARHAYYLEKDILSPDTNFFTTNHVYWNPQLLWTVHFDRIKGRLPLELHLNFGGVLTKSKSNSMVVAAVGLEYFATKALSLYTEISGESSVLRYAQSFSTTTFNDDKFYLTPGLRIKLPRGFTTSLAGDFGLTDRDVRTTINRSGYTYTAKGLPTYGVQLTVAWNGILKHADNDKDGISNKDDKCMDQAEDKDGFEDDDGCPDPDNDGDGILDTHDKCPDEKTLSDGCPVFDADGDGIMDDKDKCPTKFEDMDGFEDADGCPDLDNDGDGIPDTKDKCPNEMEDKDGFEDADGCMDSDNDNDGIMDSNDKCPNNKGLADKEGCPVTEEIRGALVLDGVAFLPGKNKLDPNSYKILDKVVQSLTEWPEINVEIRGYTDSQGSDALNLKLSQKRAEAVMNYLIKKGVSASRLSAVGYGEQNPIDDNTTEEGRARNRRVELQRM